MLFDIGNDIFESEKERNLYYKFFAGYFFNELVSGYEKRLERFKEILQQGIVRGNINWDDFTFSSAHTHVSFDNHAYLLGIGKDRGEFADILIHDPVEKVLVAVEAKFLSKWSFKKDIVGNANRLKEIKKRMTDDTKIIQCLLVTKTKWDRSQKKLGEDLPIPIVVVMWDDFLESCDDDVVKQYLQKRLELTKDKARYMIKEGRIRKA